MISWDFFSVAIVWEIQSHLIWNLTAKEELDSPNTSQRSRNHLYDPAHASRRQLSLHPIARQPWRCRSRSAHHAAVLPLRTDDSKQGARRRPAGNPHHPLRRQQLSSETESHRSIQSQTLQMSVFHEVDPRSQHPAVALLLTTEMSLEAQRVERRVGRAAAFIRAALSL
jgi:hypothetical protein